MDAFMGNRILIISARHNNEYHTTHKEGRPHYRATVVEGAKKRSEHPRPESMVLGESGADRHSYPHTYP
jgi:hypothetical protein